jgi:C-terminal processing protease CtpA/Prc
MKLLVGDGSLESLNLCNQLFGNCSLLDSTTDINTNSNYHTSINDILSPNVLENLIKSATEVKVGPLNENDYVTKTLLRSNQKLHSKDCIGDEVVLTENDILFLGCSHTYGYALDREKRFGYINIPSFYMDEANLNTVSKDVAKEVRDGGWDKKLPYKEKKD